MSLTSALAELQGNGSCLLSGTTLLNSLNALQPRMALRRKDCMQEQKLQKGNAVTGRSFILQLWSAEQNSLGR